MTKCETCGAKVETTFLNKMLGTVVKDARGKKHTFCSACQGEKTKADLLAGL